jgi:SAM-dependent methyltransferase
MSSPRPAVISERAARHLIHPGPEPFRVAQLADPRLDPNVDVLQDITDVVGVSYSNVTVLDISPMALEKAKARLGTSASSVRWLEGDITTLELPPATFAFWHDRAVFHFLREAADRAHYVATLRRSVPEGGHVLIGTFGPEGPERCSGLDVVRYSVERLGAQFGEGFDEVDRQTETHLTPLGRTQQFVYWHARRVHPVGDRR